MSRPFADPKYGVYAYRISKSITFKGATLERGDIVYVGVDSQIHKQKRHKQHLQKSRRLKTVINHFLQHKSSVGCWEYVILKEYPKPSEQENTPEYQEKMKKLILSIEAKYVKQWKPYFNREEGGGNEAKKNNSGTPTKRQLSIRDSLTPLKSMNIMEMTGVDPKLVELYGDDELDNLIFANARGSGKSFNSSLYTLSKMIRDPNLEVAVFRKDENATSSYKDEVLNSVAVIKRLTDINLLPLIKAASPPNAPYQLKLMRNGQKWEDNAGYYFYGMDNWNKPKGFTVPEPKYISDVIFEEFAAESEDGRKTNQRLIQIIRSLTVTFARTSTRAGEHLKYHWLGNSFDPDHPVIKFANELSDNEDYVKWAMKDPFKNNLWITKHYDKEMTDGTDANSFVDMGNVAVIYASWFVNPINRRNRKACRKAFRALFHWTDIIQERWEASETAAFSTWIGKYGQPRNDDNAMCEIIGRIHSGIYQNKVYTAVLKDYHMEHAKILLKYRTVTNAYMGIDVDEQDEVVITMALETKTKLEGRRQWLILSQLQQKSKKLPRGAHIVKNAKFINDSYLAFKDALQLLTNNPKMRPTIFCDDDKGVYTREFNDRFIGEQASFKAVKKNEKKFRIPQRIYAMKLGLANKDIIICGGNDILLKEMRDCFYSKSDPTKREENHGSQKLNRINSLEYSLYIAFKWMWMIYNKEDNL